MNHSTKTCRVLRYNVSVDVNLTIDEIRLMAVAALAQRGVVRAGVFGSMARGEAGPDSDIDFFVEFEHGRTLLDLAGLRLDLAEALGREVDVATPRSLHPAMRNQILAELVPIL